VRIRVRDRTLIRGLIIAIAVLCVALAVSLGALLPSALRTWRSDAEDRERNLVAPSASLTGSIDALSAAELDEAVERFREMPTGRGIAFAISFLHQAGFDFTEQIVGFTSQRTYLPQADGSWTSIAASQLGDEALWPLLFLLNEDVADGPEAPRSGVLLRIPVLPET